MATARRHEITWGLADMLGYLRERFDVGVADDVLRDLRATPVSEASRRGHEAMASRTGFRRELRTNWERYRRVAKGERHHGGTPHI